MSIFGPNHKLAWIELARQLDGTFSEGGWTGKDRVDAACGNWMITLDRYIESTGESSTTYTRLRTAYRNPSGFQFSVHRTGLFSGLAKTFGMQDIEVGDRPFDDAFVLRGNNVELVQALFADPRVRALLSLQPRVSMQVIDSEGWFGPKFPPDVDEVRFLAVGTIADINQLRALFDLFAAVLHRLTEIGAASDGYAGVML